LSAYADTSFLVSLYTLDGNSTRAVASMKEMHEPLLITPFGELELTNALELRVFRRELRASQRDASRAALREDIEGGVYVMKPLTTAIFEMAHRIARARTAKLGARTLDILHVASAFVLEASRFYTFDTRQAELASQAGLRIR
jgi:predicted nucleic acid-binding protein